MEEEGEGEGGEEGKGLEEGEREGEREGGTEGGRGRDGRGGQVAEGKGVLKSEGESEQGRSERGHCRRLDPFKCSAALQVLDSVSQPVNQRASVREREAWGGREGEREAKGVWDGRDHTHQSASEVSLELLSYCSSKITISRVKEGSP